MSEAGNWEEVSENLDRLEGALLNFEAAVQGGSDPGDSVHLIFRYAHNLKSSFSMGGHLDDSRLIHQVEEHFDRIRNGLEAPGLELTQASLRAVDLLKESVARGLVHHPETEPLTAQLADLRVADRVIPPPLIPPELEAVWKDRGGAGQRLIRVEKIISTHLPEEFFQSLPCFDEAAAAGEVLLSTPSWADLDHSAKETLLRLWILTSKDRTQLRRILSDPFQVVLGEEDHENWALWGASSAPPNLPTPGVWVPCPGEDWASLPPGPLPLVFPQIEALERLKSFRSWEQGRGTWGPGRRPVLIHGLSGDATEFWPWALAGADGVLGAGITSSDLAAALGRWRDLE